jgi:serine acetyltransferase
MSVKAEGWWTGSKNRVLQLLSRLLPGAMSLRVWLNRWRGVNIGNDVWIGYDVIIETSSPQLVTIGDGVSIGMRVTIIAHFHEQQGVTIEKDAFIGPAAVILPGVRIGQGAMVTAGSVVTHSVSPMTVVQGNPAKPVAKCLVPLKMNISLKEFTRNLKPLRQGSEL